MATVNLLPEVKSFLAQSPLTGWIGGRRAESAKWEVFAAQAPGSLEILAEVHAMQPEDVDRAVHAAAETFAQSSWAKLAANDRGVWIYRLADAIESRKKILGQIEALDCGKILGQAEGDVQNLADMLRFFADMALHIPLRTAIPTKGYEAWTWRQPWGPCGFIVPWNFPLLLVGYGIAPALAAGNTVVIKPAEDASLSTIYLAQLAKEIGFPDGVINVLPGMGDVTGAALAAHPRLKRMAFTGSPEVGRLVAAACGKNLVPVKLELGGKGAAVVFDDVDLEKTVDALVGAITLNAGQVCCNATRWLIHKPIYDRFVSMAVDRLQKIRIGHPLERRSQMGPVISEKQRKRVLGYLQRGREEGAETLLEGGAAEVEGCKGFYVKPALLAGSLDNVAAREEIFGPVAYLAAFDDESQAIEMANHTEYGLGNSVWTSDLVRARRVAEAMVAGNNWINAHNVLAFGVAYAGINKSGFGGGVNSKETLFDYWRATSIARPI
jgi:aldehyde dehydrogenase (NAD+)